MDRQTDRQINWFIDKLIYNLMDGRLSIVNRCFLSPDIYSRLVRIDWYETANFYYPFHLIELSGLWRPSIAELVIGALMAVDAQGPEISYLAKLLWSCIKTKFQCRLSQRYFLSWRVKVRALSSWTSTRQHKSRDDSHAARDWLEWRGCCAGSHVTWETDDLLLYWRECVGCRE